MGWYNDTTRGAGYYQAFSDGADGWTSPAWTPDDEDAIYIENNYILYYSNLVACNWGSGARVVVRFNDMYETPDHAGVGIWAKPGTQYFIVHNNYIEKLGTQGGSIQWVNQSALSYNNYLKNWSNTEGGGHYEAYRHYSDYFIPLQMRL